MRKDTFQTIHYRSGYIHSHCENGVQKVHATLPDNTNKDCKSIHAAKMAITAFEKQNNPLPEFSIERHPITGAYRCSAIYKGNFVWERYIGYTKKEAKELFTEKLKSLGL